MITFFDITNKTQIEAVMTERVKAEPWNFVLGEILVQFPSGRNEFFNGRPTDLSRTFSVLLNTSLYHEGHLVLLMYVKTLIENKGKKINK